MVTVDIDECLSEIHNCSSTGGVCINTIGSYNCSCDTCYIGDGIFCSLVDCGLPEIPLNAFWTGLDTTCGSRSNFSCVNGFHLLGKGNETTTCMTDGSWSTADIYCTGKMTCTTTTLNTDECNEWIHRCLPAWSNVDNLWFSHYAKRHFENASYGTCTHGISP